MYIYLFVTFAISSHIFLATKAHEILRLRVKPTSPTSFGHVLAPEATCCHRNFKIDPDPIFRDLVIVRRLTTDVPPVHASVAGTVPKHQPQGLGGFGVVRTARSSAAQS